MYKKANKFQNGKAILRLKDLYNFAQFENLTPIQQRENYVAVYKQLSEMDTSNLTKQQKIERGQKIHELTNKIREIRPKVNGKPQVRDHFIDVAKEVLPKYLYTEIMDKASERARDGRKAKPVSISEKIASLVS